jgi:hypothetical protein
VQAGGDLCRGLAFEEPEHDQPQWRRQNFHTRAMDGEREIAVFCLPVERFGGGDSLCKLHWSRAPHFAGSGPVCRPEQVPRNRPYIPIGAIGLDPRQGSGDPDERRLCQVFRGGEWQPPSEEG